MCSVYLSMLYQFFIRQASNSVVSIPEASPDVSANKHKIDWLNDSLYQWVCPTHPRLEILFFHDLNWENCEDVHFKTWESRSSPPVCWPQAWLNTEFPHARILCARYDGGLVTTATKGRMPLHNIAENFMVDIISSNATLAIPNAQNRPVFLVGHGFGGLVIKQLICMVQERLHAQLLASTTQTQSVNGWARLEASQLQNFTDNVAGVFFYGTPFKGSTLADTVKCLPNMGPLWTSLETFDAETSRLNEWFRTWKGNSKKACKTGYIHPVCLTKLEIVSKFRRFPYHVEVAKEGSGRSDVDRFYSVNKDHLNVCKPNSKEDGAFNVLTNFIKELNVPPHTHDLTVEEKGLCHRREPHSLSCALGPSVEKSTCSEIEGMLAHFEKRDEDIMYVGVDMLSIIMACPTLEDKFRSILANLGFNIGQEELVGQGQADFVYFERNDHNSTANYG